MNKLSYTLEHNQMSALEGLAYWVANENYIRERFGNDEPEIKICTDTITKCIFPECDQLKIPFWVQNTVICFAENWRRYKTEYLSSFLKTKNILQK